MLAIEMGASARDLVERSIPIPRSVKPSARAAEVYFGTATDLYRPKTAVGEKGGMEERWRAGGVIQRTRAESPAQAASHLTQAAPLTRGFPGNGQSAWQTLPIISTASLGVTLTAMRKG